MSVDFFTDWTELNPAELPDSKLGPFLTTNNPDGRNSAASGGRPSHVWLVSMFHATTDVEGPVMAFDASGFTKLWGLKLYKPVFSA